MTPAEKNELIVLLSHLREGLINEQQFCRLDSLIISCPQAGRYYLDYIKLWRDLLCFQSASQRTAICEDLLTDGTEAAVNPRLWDELARNEQEAPAMEIPPVPHSFEVIQDVRKRKEELSAAQKTTRINKSFLFVTIASLAALMFMIAYIQLVPHYKVEPVATIKDSIHSQFIGDDIAAGSRLTNRKDCYSLKHGIVEIEFDYGAKVVIEAPAEFRLDSPEKMILHSGRAYARVPAKATGFIVDTPNSRVIDLGTEFGVLVNYAGASEVHLFKGKASLIPGSRDHKGQSQSLAAGQSCSIDISGKIQNIQSRVDAFIRGFSSKTGFIRRGDEDISIVRLPTVGTDAATGISPAKTYTHLLDFGGGTAAVINGTAFTQVNHKHIYDTSYEDTENHFRFERDGGTLLGQTYKENITGAEMFSDGGMRNLLSDYTFLGGDSTDSPEQYSLTLTGLKPATRYSLRLYYCPDLEDKMPRDNLLTFDANGTRLSVRVNENEEGAHFIRYDYIAGDQDVCVTFKALSGSKDWHLCGVTNEIASE